MKLPNARAAIVEEGKVRDYLLSPTHPVGRFKAAFFGMLGYAKKMACVREETARNRFG